MTVARRTPMLAGLVALVVVAGGCAGGDGRPVGAGPTTPAPTRVTTPILPPAPTPVTAAPSPSTSVPGCLSAGSSPIPDGSWAGPLTATVRGSDPATRTQGTGSGELQVLVENGRVTGGTWALTWTSAGASTANGSQATLRLRGGVAGTVTGTASNPVLKGEWVVTGRATVTAPVTATAPIEARGRGRTPLAAKVRGCRAVAGSFTPRFASGNAWAGSGGAVRWVGRPTQ